MHHFSCGEVYDIREDIRYFQKRGGLWGAHSSSMARHGRGHRMLCSITVFHTKQTHYHAGAHHLHVLAMNPLFFTIPPLVTDLPSKHNNDINK